MKVYNLGIVGFGGFGQFLKNSWEKLDNVKVIAVADEIADRNPGGDVKFYSDWHDLAASNGVDIVSISTPPCSHAEIACAMMESGKHILVEKPMATTVKDARKIIATRDKTGRAATVDYMIRFNPMMEVIAHITKSNVLGRLRHFNLENYAQDDGLPLSHWFWDKDIAGGILIEHAVHFIDLVHSLTDQRYTAVAGLAHNRNGRQEDQVLAAVHYNGGLIATHYHSFARPGFFENTSMRLNYDLAQIDIAGWIPLCGQINTIINSKNLAELEKLPGFKITHRCSVSEVQDQSRPSGWGGVKEKSAGHKKIKAGGIEYEVEENVIAEFGLEKPKQEVYTDSVRRMLCDLIRKIENPDHTLRVSLEDGLSSLEIACKATEMARNI